MQNKNAYVHTFICLHVHMESAVGLLLGWLKATTIYYRSKDKRL